MSGKDLEFYMQDQTAFDSLSDDDKARLFAGKSIEGDTNADQSAEDSSTPPGAADTLSDADNDAGVKNAQEPEILAKDGKHTIPFSALEQERARVAALEQQLAELKQVSQSAKVPDTPVAQESIPDQSAELSALVRQRDEALYEGDTDKAHGLSMQIIGIQNKQAIDTALRTLETRESERTEQNRQQAEINAALARADALVETYPFLNPDSPKANQDAIDLVVARRDALMREGVPFADAIEQAVNKVAPLFGGAAKPGGDVSAIAAKAIANANKQNPVSLSQAPAGASVHHDQGEAIRDADGLSLLAKFDGKSSEEIMRLVSKVI